MSNGEGESEGAGLPSLRRGRWWIQAPGSASLQMVLADGNVSLRGGEEEEGELVLVATEADLSQLSSNALAIEAARFFSEEPSQFDFLGISDFDRARVHLFARELPRELEGVPALALDDWPTPSDVLTRFAPEPPPEPEVEAKGPRSLVSIWNSGVMNALRRIGVGRREPGVERPWRDELIHSDWSHIRTEPIAETPAKDLARIAAALAPLDLTYTVHEIDGWLKPKQPGPFALSPRETPLTMATSEFERRANGFTSLDWFRFVGSKEERVLEVLLWDGYRWIFAYDENRFGELLNLKSLD